jgi:hypothetical protein
MKILPGNAGKQDVLVEDGYIARFTRANQEATLPMLRMTAIGGIASAVSGKDAENVIPRRPFDFWAAGYIWLP